MQLKEFSEFQKRKKKPAYQLSAVIYTVSRRIGRFHICPNLFDSTIQIRPILRMEKF